MTPRLCAALALVSLASSSAACSDCGRAPASTSAEDASDAEQDAIDASARAEVDAALPCTGAVLDVAAVVGDPTCAITSGMAKSTRAIFELAADAGKQSVRQEAKRLDDGRVEVRLVNRGTLPAALPLSWHPKIAAFIVLADNPKDKTIFELEAPPLGVDLDGGPATSRFARATIAPGGYAFMRIAIDPKIVRRVGKGASAADAAPPPAKLGEGKWVLHIGQLVTDVETGEPATLPWLVEATD